MTLDNRFTATMPASLEDSQAFLQPPDGPQMDYLLAGAIGKQLEGPLAVLQRGMAQLSAPHAQPLRNAVDAIYKIALQSQLLSSIGNETIRHAHAQVGMDAVVNTALDQRSSALRGRGVEVYRSIKPVTVVVDLDLVSMLVDAAIDWCGELGQRLVVSLETKRWPAHGVLTLKCIATSPQTSPRMTQAQQTERLSWYLVSEIARTIGATLDRVTSPDETLLMIEFPRTVQQMDGLSAVELDLTHDSGGGLPSRMLAGHRVLIVTSDVRLREDTKRVCRNMGLLVDSVPSSLLAMRACETERPELIIVDERFKDDTFEQLRAALLSEWPNFPFIEIAYAGNTSSMAGWMGDGMTRVNRQALADDLPQAVTLEMAKLL